MNNNYYEIKEFLTLLLFVSLFVMAILIPVFGFFMYMDSIACGQKYDDSQYRVAAGCMVMHEGKYIPESLYMQTFTQNVNLQLKK